LHRNCFLKHVIEGRIEARIEVTGQWGRRCKQLLDDLQEKRGSWKLKKEALDGTLWRTWFGRGYGCHMTHHKLNKWMNETVKITIQILRHVTWSWHIEIQLLWYLRFSQQCDLDPEWHCKDITRKDDFLWSTGLSQRMS
jgi:hypothetical protein